MFLNLWERVDDVGLMNCTLNFNAWTVGKGQGQPPLQHVRGGMVPWRQGQRKLRAPETETGSVSRNGACKGMQHGNRAVHPENLILKDTEGGHRADSKEPISELRI